MSETNNLSYNYLKSRAKSALNSTKSIYNAAAISKDYYMAFDAAFELAMSAEYMLKALLAKNGNDISETHDHIRLIDICGRNGIKIPSEIRSYGSVLKEYQQKCRYDEEYDFDKIEFEYVEKIVEKYINILLNDDADSNKASTIRNKADGILNG